MKPYQFKYHVDETRRLIVFRVAGSIPSAVLIDSFIAAYRSIADPWRYDRLIDYRRYTGLTDFADIETFAERNGEINGGQPPQYKVAVVSSDAFEQARPATTRHLFAEDIRTFSSMDDALDWLSGAREPGEKAASRSA